jgi:MoxR-like ATPase
MPGEELRKLHECVDKARSEMEKVIVGQHNVVRYMLVTIFCGGHALLEGAPGVAKTLMVRVLSRVFEMRFSRIQFTPDLMPSDIIGTNVFNMKTNEFVFREGPVFTDILLADEINRTPAKTQAALLEVMQERAVTVDGVRRKASDNFTVFATQNPIEYEGTYQLPEAQRDRFLLKILVNYPSSEEEDQMLARFNRSFRADDLDAQDVQPVLKLEDIEFARKVIESTKVEEDVLRYVREVISATRDSSSILLGAGPRAGIHLLAVSKALGALAGRDFMTPDDVKEAALPALRHRIILQPEVEVEGASTDDVIRDILRRIDVPR